MNRRSLALTVLLLLASPAFAQWKYPPSKKGDVVDIWHGKSYPDPYRWMENLKDKETEAWFKAQSDLTESILSTLPGRKALVDEWLALDKLKPAAYHGVELHNGRAFYKKTLGGENVGKLYVREGYTGPEKLLFDPTTYTKEGNTVVQSFLPSWDGRHVVLGLTAAGAEYSELRILNVDTGQLLPEKIYPSWGPYGWHPDNQSFFYDIGKVLDIKHPEIELNRKTRLHKLHTPASEDLDFLSNESYPDLGIAPKEWPSVIVDEESPDHLIANIGTVQNEMRIYVAPVADAKAGGKLKWQPICTLADNLVRGLTLHKDHVYAITHTGAPKYKLVRTSLKSPDWKAAETVIPEQADSIQGMSKSRNHLLVTYSNGITGRVLRHDLATGKTTELKLPAQGTVWVSTPDWKSDLFHVVITSWTQPSTRYDYDAKSDAFTKSPFHSDVVYPGFDQLISEEVEVPSHDGTMVPLSIVRRKDLKLDGSAPCILEGYGAYGMSMPPHFNVQHSVALRGVVLAWAHPRGGSEKGEAWYKAGHKTTKPNTWKDFIACADYLCKKGYSSPARMTGTGTSAGGILISRAITDRPDLFRAAICNVGCANTLRMEFTPNGPVNIPEFGTVTIQAEAEALAEMDGVSHVKPNVTYPAVLGVAGWNDPRVEAWQTGKFLAALQNVTPSDAPNARPMLMKVNYDNGHFTEEKSVTFLNFASQYAFLLWQAGHKDFQPGK